MMIKHHVITTGTVAAHCHVTYETVKNWIKQGKLDAFETPGGHHRILLDDFKAFIETYGMPPYGEGQRREQRLLIVDDDDVIVNNIVEFFKKTDDYECATASDGYEAGIQVIRFDPDLIVLDLFLPNLDGFELCRKIKNDPASRHIKVLAITAHPEEEHQKRILEYGADAFLAKPFTLKVLKEHIKALLDAPSKAGRFSLRSKSRKTA